MNGDDQTTRALAREVGRNSVERLGDGLRRLLGEAMALFRLLLCAVFLLNVAGFWFRFSFADTIAPERHDEVAVLFGMGATVALHALLISLLFTIPLARAMRRAITNWTQVSVTGDLSDEAMADAKRVKLTGTVWLGVTSLVGFGALVLFVTGVQVASNDFAVFTRALEPAPIAEPAPRALNAAEVPGVPSNAAANVTASTPIATSTPAPAVSPSRPAAAPRETRAAPRPRPSATPVRPAALPPPTRTPAASPLPAPAPAAPAPQPAPSATP
jgi:hypothetical protein